MFEKLLKAQRICALLCDERVFTLKSLSLTDGDLRCAMLGAQKNMSNQAKPRQVIINADDFGMSREVNRGVFDCYRAGAISSATMIVNSSASTEASFLAKQCPGLGVGLHFNLTHGKPVSCPSKVSSLLNQNGLFLNSRSLKKRWLCRRILSGEIVLELQAQFERMLSFGLSPTHVDSHDHIHVVPIVFNALAEFCCHMELPIRMPWVHASIGRLPRNKRVSRFVRKVMLKHNWRQWQFRVRSNRSFVSILDLAKESEDVVLQDYWHLLGATHHNPIELMVHPAHIDHKQKNLSTLSRINKAEIKILSQRAFRTMLKENGFELVSFSKV